MNNDESANGQGGIGTQPVHQNMAGWTLALERFGNWLITSPTGDAARVFHDDEAPLATVMRQFLQAMVFGGEAIVAPGSQADAAVRTLNQMGYTWNGGTMWRPPLGAVPKFMLATLDRANAAAGLKPLPGETACSFRNRILAQADAPLETSEDEAKPYRAGDEKAGQIVDADYWAGDEEAISKALSELDEIAQAYDRHDMGLPLWLPEQHEKLAEVLRKMLAKQRADLAQGQPAEMSAPARDVLAERRRQQEVEGWTPEHDDEHVSGEISALAAFYAMPPAAREWDASSTAYGETLGQAILPPAWRAKVGDRREELKKAGALILAEIERLDRAAEKGGAA